MSTPAATAGPRPHPGRRSAAVLLAAFIGLGVLGGAGGAVLGGLGGLGSDPAPGVHLDHHHERPAGVPGRP